MRMRLIVGALPVVLLAALVPGVAVGDDPVAGCPLGTFNVKRDDAARWFLLRHLGPKEIKKDHNGDGWVCSRRIRVPSDQHDLEAWATKDNTRPWGRYQVIPENGISMWHEAADYCQSLGAHLVTINSAQENRKVFRLEPDTWLGATDEGGEWVWVTGEPFTYANWAPGEPNNADGEEHYAAYAFAGPDSYSPTWADLPGWVGKSFVCEYE